jgi:transposase
MSRLNVTLPRVEMVRSFYYDNKTAREVADRFGVSHHTIYALNCDPKFRGLARMRQVLDL